MKKPKNTNPFRRTRRNFNVLIIVFMFLFMFFFVLQHELTHQVICEEFGGEPSKVFYNFTGFTAYVYCEGNITYNEYEMLAQANVEAFGYQLQMAMAFIFIIVMIMGNLMIALKENDWYESEQDRAPISKFIRWVRRHE
jgi:hypothetical protein